MLPEKSASRKTEGIRTRRSDASRLQIKRSAARSISVKLGHKSVAAVLKNKVEVDRSQNRGSKRSLPSSVYSHLIATVAGKRRVGYWSGKSGIVNIDGAAGNSTLTIGSECSSHYVGKALQVDAGNRENISAIQI